MKPSVGRIVHYVSRGSADGHFPSMCRAAIVTAIQPEETISEETVSLFVMNPDGTFFNHKCGYSDIGKPGTWHWPERVD